eukprot:m.313741 g.313741  ORF g.313741 m.313741 type:complete len:150 (+) comp19664_c0_seq23:4575-5024(+)
MAWSTVCNLVVTLGLIGCWCPQSGLSAQALRDDPGFHSTWMAYLNPLLSDKTILDLSLPGTHDTLTFDLSTTVSDGANDLPPDVAWVLHEFHDFVPGHFIRDQAKTQGLNITEQLENGIRFLDFRIMFSAPPAHSAFDHHSWVSRGSSS